MAASKANGADAGGAWWWWPSWLALGRSRTHPDLVEAMQEARRVCGELYNIRLNRGSSSNEKREAIVCLVGATSCGKSALIKSLIRMPYYDNTIEVKPTAHTTLKPSQQRILDDDNNVLHIIDLPGTHGVLPPGYDASRDRPFLDQLDQIVQECCRHADIVLYCYSNRVITDDIKKDVESLYAARKPESIYGVLTKADLWLDNYTEESNKRVLEDHKLQLKLKRVPFPTTCIGYDDEAKHYGQTRIEGVDDLRLALVRELDSMKLLAPEFLERLKSGEYNERMFIVVGTVVAVPIAILGIIAVAAVASEGGV